MEFAVLGKVRAEGEHSALPKAASGIGQRSLSFNDFNRVHGSSDASRSCIRYPRQLLMAKKKKKKKTRKIKAPNQSERRADEDSKAEAPTEFWHIPDKMSTKIETQIITKHARSRPLVVHGV